MESLKEAESEGSIFRAPLKSVPWLSGGLSEGLQAAYQAENGRRVVRVGLSWTGLGLAGDWDGLT